MDKDKGIYSSQQFNELYLIKMFLYIDIPDSNNNQQQATDKPRKRRCHDEQDPRNIIDGKRKRVESTRLALSHDSGKTSIARKAKAALTTSVPSQSPHQFENPTSDKDNVRIGGSFSTAEEPEESDNTGSESDDASISSSKSVVRMTIL